MNNLTKIFFTLLLISFSSTSSAEAIDIFAAAREGDSNVIKAYVKNGGDISVTNHKSYTPFILAAYYAHLQALDTLLELGADPCALDDKGSNAFMGVAFKGHQEIAIWLLGKTSCNVNHQNYAGQTALMMASLFGRTAMIKQLLKHGANPKLTDHQGNTAEKLAQAQGLSHVVEMIKFHIQ